MVERFVGEDFEVKTVFAIERSIRLYQFTVK